MKVKRRGFLILGSLLGLSSFVDAKVSTSFEKDFMALKPLFMAVQEHLFPKGGSLPSASSVHSTDFLFSTMQHSSFDKDIRTFVLEGARELDTREKGQFTAMNSTQKEKALREYEETRYGKSWLSRMMTLTMEGMFCDPIYGSNPKEIGWKSLGHSPAFPRPKERYLGLK
jgi:gluconate 2-dehydrogenase gamma chain